MCASSCPIVMIQIVFKNIYVGSKVFNLDRFEAHCTINRFSNYVKLKFPLRQLSHFIEVGKTSLFSNNSEYVCTISFVT